MTKRLLTILILLLFSGLPAAAQVYQVATFVGEALAQSSDEGEVMACCVQAGHCQMSMPMSAPAVETSATDCPLPCSCAASDPALPSSVLALLPPPSSSDEAPSVQPPVLKWNDPPSLVALSPDPPLLPPTKVYLRHTCLRI